MIDIFGLSRLDAIQSRLDEMDDALKSINEKLSGPTVSYDDEAEQSSIADDPDRRRAKERTLGL